MPLLNPVPWFYYYDDDEIMARAKVFKKEQEQLEKWKAKQPEFIAVEMTNKEIVSAFEITLQKYPSSEKVLSTQMLAGFKNYWNEEAENQFKIIKGIIYKKAKNPKIKGNKIIPWK